MRNECSYVTVLNNCEDNAQICSTILKKYGKDFSAMGFAPLSQQEIIALSPANRTKPWLVNIGAPCIILKPKSAPDLKRAVDKITWIASRNEGAYSGTMDEMYVVIFPVGAEFKDKMSFFRPYISVYGRWHDASNRRFAMKPLPMAMCGYYNSTALTAEIRGVMQKKSIDSYVKELKDIAVKIGNEYVAIHNDWLETSGKNHYAGKLPPAFLKDLSLDGESGKDGFGPYLSTLVRSVAAGLEGGLNPRNPINLDAYQKILDQVKDDPKVAGELDASALQAVRDIYSDHGQKVYDSLKRVNEIMDSVVVIPG
jgi:hypothetical protein